MAFPPGREKGSDTPGNTIIPDTSKTVALGVRILPVSAACVAEFAGDRRQIIAALGSIAPGPAAFAGLRSKAMLPDTEEEFAPGIIAAWRTPGRALPFLVTVRNIGAEEGTDTPEGRVVLSLWDAAAGRWMSVCESPPLGKKVVAVATNTGLDGYAANLFVLCEDGDGTARFVSLTPLSPMETL